MADRRDLLPTICHFENRRGEGPGDEVGLISVSVTGLIPVSIATLVSRYCFIIVAAVICFRDRSIFSRFLFNCSLKEDRAIYVRPYESYYMTQL